MHQHSDDRNEILEKQLKSTLSSAERAFAVSPIYTLPLSTVDKPTLREGYFTGLELPTLVLHPSSVR